MTIVTTTMILNVASVRGRDGFKIIIPAGMASMRKFHAIHAEVRGCEKIKPIGEETWRAKWKDQTLNT